MNAYRKLAVAVSINTVIMFVLTYALIDQFSHFYPNVNRFYMAVLMAAPMVLVMILVMGSMYEDRRLNAVILAGAAVVFLGTFSVARAQAGVDDEQFLRSMIPHHSSAILMCENPNISDPDIEALCTDIIDAQEKEIALMKAMLDEDAAAKPSDDQ